MSTTRFPHGVTNVTALVNLGGMGQPDPTKYITYFDDFTGDGTANGFGGVTTAATTVAKATPFTCFALNAPKGAYFSAQASLATIASTTLVGGIADSLSAPTSGIYVTLTNGVTFTLSIKLGGVTTTATATVAMANATMAQFGWAYVASSNEVVGFFNNAEVCSIPVPATFFTGATAQLAGVLPTGATATIDYIFAAQER